MQGGKTSWVGHTTDMTGSPPGLDGSHRQQCAQVFVLERNYRMSREQPDWSQAWSRENKEAGFCVMGHSEAQSRIVVPARMKKKGVIRLQVKRTNSQAWICTEKVTEEGESASPPDSWIGYRAGRNWFWDYKTRGIFGARVVLNFWCLKCPWGQPRGGVHADGSRSCVHLYRRRKNRDQGGSPGE